MTSDAMKDEAIEVVEPIDEELLIDPETGWNRLMVVQMVESIKVAHQINPSSWCIHPDHNTPFVAVEMVNIGHPGFSLIVSTENLTQQQTHILESYCDKSRVYSGRPWGAYLRFPEDQVRNVLDLMRDAHLSAVERLARDVKSRTVRWKEHREDFRREFERIAGASIPEPGYLQELTDHLNSSASVGDTDPFEGIDSILLERLADDIRVAHAANPNAWSFYRIQSRGIILIVEAITVSYVTTTGGGWILLGDSDAEAYASVDRERIVTGYKYFPGFYINATSVDDLVSLATEYKEPHEAGIEHLARAVKTKTQRANEHQPETLKSLERRLGVELPHPAYEKFDGNVREIQHIEGRRYWRFGRYASDELWRAMAEQSIVGIENWSDSRIDLNDLPKDHDAFIQTIRQFKTIGAAAAEHGWKMRHVVQPGDMVIGMSGVDVCGWGTINGEYRYVD